MQLGLKTLFEFIATRSIQPLVLATIVQTDGPTYRKAGAMMLFDGEGNYAGLFSGGCLEDDLAAHAAKVLTTGQNSMVVYDLGLEESDAPWSLGLGCGGRLKVWLERVDQTCAYGGLSEISGHWSTGQSCSLINILEHDDPELKGKHYVMLPGEPLPNRLKVGRFELAQSAMLVADTDAQILAIPVSPQNKLLICGAGPDAIPLVRLASLLNWHVTVIDPRPAYLQPDHFPTADLLLGKTPDALDADDIAHTTAVIIMTHNLDRDAAYLSLFSKHSVPYIGLLGPSLRRDALLRTTGLSSDEILIHGPAGLDLEGALPEDIALSVMAEIQQALTSASGRPLFLK